LVVLATIFSQYTVELAVEEFASDQDIEDMPKGSKQRANIYQKAIDRADHLLKTKVDSIITLQLRDSSIPIRLVRRGNERFGL
jgi:hypothetical protein